MAPEPRRTDPWVWILVGLVVLVLVPGVLLLGASGTGMMGGGGWMGSWGFLGMGLVVVVVVLILAVLLLVPRGEEALAPPPYPYAAYPAPPATPPAGSTAIQILDARYARGEIPRDEYLRMRQDLESRKP